MLAHVELRFSLSKRRCSCIAQHVVLRAHCPLPETPADMAEDAWQKTLVMPALLTETQAGLVWLMACSAWWSRCGTQQRATVQRHALQECDPRPPLCTSIDMLQHACRPPVLLMCAAAVRGNLNRHMDQVTDRHYRYMLTCHVTSLKPHCRHAKSRPRTACAWYGA
jgi:hypothetical protein